MYPEHTARAYREAARQGADVIECDLAITKVKEKMNNLSNEFDEERNEIEESMIVFLGF